ncbi:MAG TPA: hypothetical protein VGL88_04850, partial [Pseudonocardiaceae bacterium]
LREGRDHRRQDDEEEDRLDAAHTPVPPTAQPPSQCRPDFPARRTKPYVTCRSLKSQPTG